MKAVVIGIAVVISAVTLGAQVNSQETTRIQSASDVVTQMRHEPDKGVPQDLWQKAQCVIVIPSLKKGALGIGGEYGRGLMDCRNDAGWSAPVFMELEKGSWGFQIGGEAVDLILLVMNDGGMKKMLQDKVSLGADASVAAGPVGRNAAASTDVQMTAEVLSYSRSKGLFAGIDVSGGVLKPDGDANRDLYGHDITPTRILSHDTAVPDAARLFVAALSR